MQGLKVALTIVLAVGLLGGSTVGVAAQDEGSSPWFGGRIEMPEHGFAVTLPMTWVALDPKRDLAAQQEAVRQAWGDSSYTSFASPNPVRDALAAYGGPGSAPQSQYCVIGVDNGDAASLSSSVARLHETLVSSEIVMQPPGSIREVMLPAGVAYAIDYAIDDGAVEQTSYFVSAEGRRLHLQCLSLGDRPDDDWLPIAETLELLPAAGAFELTGSLAEQHRGHGATLLPDGRVLVVGGGSALAEIWDPATASFTPAGSLAEGRFFNTATPLPDGRVLVVGGWDAEGDIIEAELWGPATDTLDPAGSLAEARSAHTATLLHDGSVLVVGGGSNLAEVWDPATVTFSTAGSLDESRALHSSTPLPDGRVLVVGGVHDGDVLASAEVWDPATATFSPAGSLAKARAGHTATLLPDERVLVVGGGGAEPSDVVSPAEIWDPATASFTPAGSLAEARRGHSATLLPEGNVLALTAVTISLSGSMACGPRSHRSRERSSCGHDGQRHRPSR